MSTAESGATRAKDGRPLAGTMRAARIEAPGRVRLEHVPVPEPAAGEIRVRIEGCGVCGSHGPVWEGREWFEYPLEPGAPGHEAWGVVDALGEGVDAFAPGDRVSMLSYRAFAEYDVASAASAVRIPPELAGVPFPGEPLACAMNVFERADVRPGHTVAVIGVGFLGALVAQLAARAGARVIGISRRSFSLEVARAMGVDDTLELDDLWRVRDAVGELTGGAFCDRVIEAVGTQEPLTLAGEITRVRGRLVVAGFHQEGKREVDMQLWNWRGIDVINAHERDEERYVDGMRRAAQATLDGRLDASSLYTHTFALDRLGDALDALGERPDGFLKALVVP